jgi:hypothetical protein
LLRESYRGSRKSSNRCSSKCSSGGGLGELGKPVVIEPDKGEIESHDEGAYAAFKEAIKVKDHKASYL